VYKGIKLMSSIPMVAIMKAERLIRHDCEAYLAFVTIDGNSKAKLSKLPVVCEFPNVLSQPRFREAVTKNLNQSTFHFPHYSFYITRAQ